MNDDNNASPSLPCIAKSPNYQLLGLVVLLLITTLVTVLVPSSAESNAATSPPSSNSTTSTAFLWLGSILLIIIIITNTIAYKQSKNYTTLFLLLATFQHSQFINLLGHLAASNVFHYYLTSFTDGLSWTNFNLVFLSSNNNTDDGTTTTGSSMSRYATTYLGITFPGYELFFTTVATIAIIIVALLLVFSVVSFYQKRKQIFSDTSTTTTNSIALIIGAIIIILLVLGQYIVVASASFYLRQSGRTEKVQTFFVVMLTFLYTSIVLIFCPLVISTNKNYFKVLTVFYNDRNYLYFLVEIGCSVAIGSIVGSLNSNDAQLYVLLSIYVVIIAALLIRKPYKSSSYLLIALVSNTIKLMSIILILVMNKNSSVSSQNKVLSIIVIVIHLLVLVTSVATTLAVLLKGSCSSSTITNTTEDYYRHHEEEQLNEGKMMMTTGAFASGEESNTNDKSISHSVYRNTFSRDDEGNTHQDSGATAEASADEVVIDTMSSASGESAFQAFTPLGSMTDEYIENSWGTSTSISVDEDQEDNDDDDDTLGQILYDSTAAAFQQYKTPTSGSNSDNNNSFREDSYASVDTFEDVNMHLPRESTLYNAQVDAIAKLYLRPSRVDDHRGRSGSIGGASSTGRMSEDIYDEKDMFFNPATDNQHRRSNNNVEDSFISDEGSPQKASIVLDSDTVYLDDTYNNPRHSPRVSNEHVVM